MLFLILQSTMGLAFWQSVGLIGVNTIIYSLQGGMKAVVYGDAFQMCLIVIGALVCLGFGLYHIAGWQQLFSQSILKSSRPAHRIKWL